MKTYSDVISRLNDQALIGFEFEVIVRPNSEMFVSGEESRFTEDISYYHWGDLISRQSNLAEYFDISSRDRTSIEDDYAEWLNDEAETWATQHYEDFRQNHDEREEELVDKAKESFINLSDNRKHPGHPDNFVEYRGGIKGILRYHNLEPVHGWHDDTNFYTSEASDEPNFEATSENCATSLSSAGIKTTVGDPGPDYSTWGITSDGSLPSDHDEGQGIEVISTPLPPSEAIKQMNIFFDWMKGYNITTNEDCGLHINISIPELKDKLDPFKLALFLGEEYMLAAFKRTNSVYAKPMLDDIFNSLQKTGTIPKLPKEMLDLSLDILSNHVTKYRTANLSKLARYGYIEFRIAGGEKYHTDSQKIIEAIGRYLAVIELACDPKAELREYMKKITKLSSQMRTKIATTPETGRRDFISNNFTRFLNRSNVNNFTELTSYLSSLYNQTRDTSHNEEQIAKIKQHILQAFAEIVDILVSSSIKLSLPFNVKELVAIRAIAKQLGVDLRDVPDNMINIRAIERFKKDMRL